MTIDIVDEIVSTPDKIVENSEEALYLFETVNRLKDKYRDIMIYRIYFEMTFKQIADLMNISENSAKVLYFRGKKILKEELIREGRNCDE